MNHRRLTAVALAALALSSCISVRRDEDWSQSILLAETEHAEGESAWRLYSGPGRGNAPRVDVTHTSRVEHPRIGVSASSVTRARAEREGIEPFRGVWIDSVVGDGPAARAGLVAGDVVLAVGGAEVSSTEQFVDAVRTHGGIGEPLDLAVLVRRRAGDPTEAASRSTLTVVPEAWAELTTSTESIELDFSPALQTYTGLQVGAVPPDLAAEVYGEEEPVVVVTGIVTGSPAYRAGLRRGDRVKTCDGTAVGALDDVRWALYRRIVGKGHELEDLADRGFEGRGELVGGGIALEVEGPLGPHAATVAIDPGMRRDVDIDIPILFEYSSSVDSKRVSFLDFIFQFGFNYWRHTRASRTRESVNEWELSLLPFGMFEFERRRDSREWTFFWFIDFDVSE